MHRSENTFFKPSENFEITGQVGNVCFLEGLVFFRNKWLLYYGTADSKIAVAEASLYDYKGMLNQRAVDRLHAAKGKHRQVVLDMPPNAGEVFTRTAGGSPAREEGAGSRARSSESPRETDPELGEATSVEPPHETDTAWDEAESVDSSAQEEGTGMNAAEIQGDGGSTSGESDISGVEEL